MNNKSKPSAFPAFGIRGAKVLPFLEMAKQNVIYFYPACKDFNLIKSGWLAILGGKRVKKRRFPPIISVYLAECWLKNVFSANYTDCFYYLCP